jgi:Putative transposase/Transposase zinc-binding domain
MPQSLSQIRQLLQQKIFSHSYINNFKSYSKAVLLKLSQCHTAGIGRHHYQCNNRSCNHLHYQYHSCGNRHCMNCGGMKKEQWIQDRMGELLPTTYFHIVFTLPQELRSLCMGNRALLFNLLFEASHHTLTKLGKEPKWLGAQPGIISILHTNGQDLVFHPHVHCIVSGGGITADGIWVKEKRANGKFLFPRRLLEREFKQYFLHRLSQMFKRDELKIIDESLFHEAMIAVSEKDWNVYAKAPFGGPAQIVEYIGRYTHKVAITAHRITEIENDTITFNYKDYRDNSKTKSMTLSHQEFLRRFEQHILPRGFVKIRHAGFLTNRNKIERINNILSQLNLPKAKPKVSLPTTLLLLIKTGTDITQCPKCETGRMIRIATYLNINGQLVNIEDINNRGSPNKFKTRSS